KLWSFIKWWTLLSAALIFAGIEVKSRFDSNFGHVLAAAGTISFVGLGLLLFALSDGIASILFFKIRLAGGILNKATSIVGVDFHEALGLTGKHSTPEELAKAEAKAAKFRNRIKLILAGTVVLCFSLLFTMFFPAWSTLGWTLVFWAMVGVALTAALYLDLQMGKAVEVVFYATLALIVATFVVFVLDRLTGGALGFAGFQKWLLKVNRSEAFVALLVLLPVTLLLVGGFSKEKDRKASFLFAAKYVGIACAVLGAFLLYKGTLSWKQLSGKDAPKAVSQVIEKIENGSIESAPGNGTHAKPATPSPQGSASNGGVYMSPPNDDVRPSGDPMPQEERPAPRTTKPQAKKPPLPPLKAKKYEDASSAVDDLQTLL
ncbi:MAG TPA: hypothetical protein VL283_04715, partial [Candidatus Baltobacteraceae bacterium]|nr:hypothetical protein [Candidatus Baltobacteraceae bacterium]